MRVWDIPVEYLCNEHLIAQHHEIHCIYNIITKGLKGFAHHPETMRWRGHLPALVHKHWETFFEMLERGINHNKILDSVDTCPIVGIAPYPVPWQPIDKQLEILRSKGCGCNLET